MIFSNKFLLLSCVLSMAATNVGCKKNEPISTTRNEMPASTTNQETQLIKKETLEGTVLQLNSVTELLPCTAELENYLYYITDTAKFYSCNALAWADVSTVWYAKFGSRGNVFITTPRVASYIGAANIAAFTVGGICNKEGGTVSVKADTVVVGSAPCTLGVWNTSAIDLSAVPEGPVSLTAILVDVASTSTTSSTVTITKDVTPPSMGPVSTGNLASLTTAPAANWTTPTDTSGIGAYEIAIGTTPGGTDTKAWTAVGVVVSYTVTGLSLASGSTYYTSVRATDKAGNVSPAVTAEGWSTAMPQVSGLAVGNSHSCILVDGGVKCWGNNSNGQLGTDSTTQSKMPVNVISLPSPVQGIAAGFSHTCAIVAGAAKCWGNNSSGQLGDNTKTTPRKIPVDVMGLTSGVTSIAASSTAGSTCAVVNGAAKCWGNNTNGQLGNNSLIQAKIPVNVTGLSSGVQNVVVGDFHACALLVTGGVKCWGLNYSGQLGDNSVIQKKTPVDVNGLSVGVQSIVAGSRHTCALLVAGGVKCWGYNANGQLGTNSTTQSKIPMDVNGLEAGVQGIATGDNHTCAIVAGAAKCWGNNYSGQLGNDSVTQSKIPVDVSNLGSGVVAIEGGVSHTCALLSNGGVKCWGFNANGQLGNNSLTRSLIPVSVGL